MRFRRLSAATAAAAAVAVLLSGCAPGVFDAADEIGESSAPVSIPETAAPVQTPQVAEPNLVVATLAAGDSIAVLDPAASAPLVQQIVVGQAPWDVEVAGTTAFVSTAEGLAVVDLIAGARTALVPYLDQPEDVTFGEYRDGGLGLAVAPDGATVYVAVHSWPEPARIEVFDVASLHFTTSVAVGVRPFQVLVSDDGSTVFSIDHDTYTVSMIDTETLAVRQVEVAPFGSGQGFAGWEKLHYGVLDADGALLLPVQGLVLARLDPVTGAVTSIPMVAASHSHGVAITTEQVVLTSGTGVFGTATNGPSLDILNLATGAEQVVPLAHPHETVVAWSDTQGAESALLAGGFTRDGWWDGLTLVSLDSLEVREIPLEGRPQDLALVEDYRY